MSYLNGVTGYRDDLLINRSIVKRHNFAVIEPDGLVKNSIPGFKNCAVTILASPKLGASFVDYLLTAEEGGQLENFGGPGIEIFLYVMRGGLTVWSDDGTRHALKEGGYIFCGPGQRLNFENESADEAFCFLYKRRFQPLPSGEEPKNYVGNINEVEGVHYEGMKDVLVKDFLPAAHDMSYDMNFHILSFEPGASHGYIETHFQEHGAYIYSGQGMYNLDNNWMPVKKGDYIFMGAYSLQAAYGVGRDEPFAYVYSKDCNRDVEI